MSFQLSAFFPKRIISIFYSLVLIVAATLSFQYLNNFKHNLAHLLCVFRKRNKKFMIEENFCRLIERNHENTNFAFRNSEFIDIYK